MDIPVVCVLVQNHTKELMEQKRQSLISTALASCPDAVLIIDTREARVVFANQATEKLLKANSVTPKPQIVGRRSFELLPELHDKLRIDPGNGSPYQWSGRSQLVCVDGETISADVHLNTLPRIDNPAADGSWWWWWLLLFFFALLTSATGSMVQIAYTL